VFLVPSQKMRVESRKESANQGDLNSQSNLTPEQQIFAQTEILCRVRHLPDPNLNLNSPSLRE
jgi:hypothetical protein